MEKIIEESTHLYINIYYCNTNLLITVRVDPETIKYVIPI